MFMCARFPAHPVQHTQSAAADKRSKKRRQQLKNSREAPLSRPDMQGSSEVRTQTPDVADVTCAGVRKKVAMTGRGLVGVRAMHPALDPALNRTPPCPSSSARRRESSGGSSGGVAGEGEPAAQQAAAVLSMPIPSPGRAQPFSLGVQWDAYHNNPTVDTPGYPRGFWSNEASPFAAFALQPLWETL